jgi:hypothetical protein
LRLNDRFRWKIALENLAYGCILDEGELNAKQDHNTKDQGDHEKLKGAKPFHGSIGTVEEENEKNVDD